MKIYRNNKWLSNYLVEKNDIFYEYDSATKVLRLIGKCETNHDAIICGHRLLKNPNKAILFSILNKL